MIFSLRDASRDTGGDIIRLFPQPNVIQICAHAEVSLWELNKNCSFGPSNCRDFSIFFCRQSVIECPQESSTILAIPIFKNVAVAAIFKVLLNIFGDEKFGGCRFS